MNRRLLKQKEFHSEANTKLRVLLPLVIANCFRNLAIASGQGKKALDLEDKIEDLNEMKPPSIDFASLSTDCQLFYLQYAQTYSFFFLLTRVIKQTALVSGNSNCGDESTPENADEDEVLTENEGPRAIDVVSNWEAVKEGLCLLTQLALAIQDEALLSAYTQFIIEIGSNSLHQGILQQVHFSLIEILTHLYTLSQEKTDTFIHLTATILAIPVSIHLPIIRRSAGLPFMVWFDRVD